ncbi:MAG: glycine--tRNA ligase subunit beta [Burkholderiales bacterium]
MPKKKNAKASEPESLLVELLTEELPPKILKRLSESFGEYLYDFLSADKFLTSTNYEIFTTPRRLAAWFPAVREIQEDRDTFQKGPYVTSGQDAIAKFASKYGVDLSKLERQTDKKGEYVLLRVHVKGERLDQRLAEKVEEAIKHLRSPKLMRWGNNKPEFVRPVHGLMMMHGSRIVLGEIWGLKSSNQTLGHRFLSSGEIKIPAADQYEAVLEKNGSVIASFAKRKELIRAAIEATAAGAKPLLDGALLDEVTALVEFPVVYPGGFSAEFLSVPQECLILSMKQHQKYIPLTGTDGNLLPRFLIVSNLKTNDPTNIICGNERVLRARLADAKFFYDQDRKTRLEARVPRLASVIYHNKLGNQLERVERIQLLAGKVARQIGADPLLAERAAWLAKADLLTDMVGEFPELQGIMGRYYALHDGEPNEVADAIEAHYRPRFADDHLPISPIACAVAFADKLDTLAGLFGIGQVPTGDKDPFGLRRAALGVIRILIERDLPLSLHELVNAAFAGYNGRVGDAHTNLSEFIFNRLDGYLRDCGYSALEVESVVSKRPVQINLVPRQVEAVRAFNALPEAQSLAAANKRVVNILKQAEANGESFVNAEADKLQEPAERALFDALKITSQQAAPLFKKGDFTGYLKTFAVLKSPVDAFFDSVMVMVEDSKLRQNRLALLADLRTQMNRVADISKLAV